MKHNPLGAIWRRLSRNRAAPCAHCSARYRDPMTADMAQEHLHHAAVPKPFRF